MGKKKTTTVSAEAEMKVKKVKKSTTKAEVKTDEVMGGEVVAEDTKKKSVKKVVVKKVRGKRFLNAKAKVIKGKKYPITEAILELKKMSFERFDASVELHINLLEVESVKGQVNLPHGTGKTVKVAVFGPEVEAKIKENIFDFDVLLAKTEDMKILVKYAKVLGPKGLMPSPKRGTLVANIEEAKAKFMSGNMNFSSEPKFPIVHQVVGKISFTPKQLEENVVTFLKAVQKKNIQDAFLTTSMTPSLRLNLENI